MILTENDLRVLSMLEDGKIPEAAACLTWSMVGVVDTDVIAQYEDTVGHDLSERKPDAGPLDVSILPAAAVIGLRLAETADGAAWHKQAKRLDVDGDVEPQALVERAAESADPAYLAAVLDAVEALGIPDEHDRAQVLDNVNFMLPLAVTLRTIAKGMRPATLSAYADLGLTEEEAYDAADRGEHPYVIRHARRLHREPAALVGVQEDWLSAADSEDIDLYVRLSKTPWRGESHFRLRGWGGTKTHFHLEQACRYGEAGLSVHDVERYREALGGRRRYGATPERWESILLLHEAGVRSSHITEYRMSGVADTVDMIALAAEGIGGGRVKYLRATYGTLASRYDRKRRLSGPDSLRRLHAADPDKVAAS